MCLMVRKLGNQRPRARGEAPVLDKNAQILQRILDLKRDGYAPELRATFPK